METTTILYFAELYYNRINAAAEPYELIEFKDLPEEEKKRWVDLVKLNLKAK